MKKLVLMFFVAMYATVSMGIGTASASTTLKGTWQFKVPSAPYEYNNGQLIVAEQEGKYAITIKFSDGSQIKAQNVKVEGNDFSFTVEVEYETVKIAGKLAEGKITAKVDSPEGLMSLTAEPLKR